MECLGSALTNKYAEGTPGNRSAMQPTRTLSCPTRTLFFFFFQLHSGTCFFPGLLFCFVPYSLLSCKFVSLKEKKKWPCMRALAGWDSCRHLNQLLTTNPHILSLLLPPMCSQVLRGYRSCGQGWGALPGTCAHRLWLKARRVGCQRAAILWLPG